MNLIRVLRSPAFPLAAAVVLLAGCNCPSRVVDRGVTGCLWDSEIAGDYHERVADFEGRAGDVCVLADGSYAFVGELRYAEDGVPVGTARVLLTARSTSAARRDLESMLDVLTAVESEEKRIYGMIMAPQAMDLSGDAWTIRPYVEVTHKRTPPPGDAIAALLTAAPGRRVFHVETRRVSEGAGHATDVGLKTLATPPALVLDGVLLIGGVVAGPFLGRYRDDCCHPRYCE